VCERSSQNGHWRFEWWYFTSKNVIYVVHVLVKRGNSFKYPIVTCTQGYVKFLRVWLVLKQGTSAPHAMTSTSKLQRHLSCLREIWIIYKRNHFSRNFQNPEKFWKSEKNWNSRFQNLEKIDLIILPNRSDRSNRKKSPNRLDRFIGQRINNSDTIPVFSKEWTWMN